MAAGSTAKNARSISDAAVQANTGKKWMKWFLILDKAGARNMPHREIAAYLYKRHKVPGWWAQMVTVEYERTRGLREKHQTASGFSASVSRTCATSAAVLYRAWMDARQRRRWLPGAAFTITTAKPNKSIRIKWSGDTRVEVFFLPEGPSKCLMSIQHNRLRDAKDFAAKKKFWAGAVERLQKIL